MTTLGLALRSLRHRPGFSALVVLTLGLGIGAATAIFTVVNAVLLKPLPYRAPDRLAMIWSRWSNFDRTWISQAEYLDYQRQQQLFQDVAAWADNGEVTITGPDGHAESVPSIQATANLLSVLGVSPQQGQMFTSLEDIPNGPAVVMVGYDLWQHRWGGDPALVGRIIQVDGQPYRVSGILPRDFRLPLEFQSRSTAQLIGPLQIDHATASRGGHCCFGVARLQPGVTGALVTSELGALAAQWTEQGLYPRDMRFTAFAVTLPDEVSGPVRPALAVLAAAVALLLLLTCANVANLILTRAESRAREVAVRAALGAGGRDMLALVLGESVVLGLAGGLVGLALAWVGVHVLVAGAPTTMPRVAELAVDWRVGLFSLGLAIGTGVVFALVPLIRIRRLDLASALRDGRGQSGGVEERRGRAVLVVAEMAFAVLLLIGSGLTVRSFINLSRIDPGFDARNVLTVRLSLPAAKYVTAEAVNAFYDNLGDAVRRLPGVASAGFARLLPLATEMGDAGLRIDGKPLPTGAPGRQADWQGVSPGYFEAMRIRLISGRFFDSHDGFDGEPVIIVNQELVKEYFSGRRSLAAADSGRQRHHLAAGGGRGRGRTPQRTPGRGEAWVVHPPGPVVPLLAIPAARDDPGDPDHGGPSRGGHAGGARGAGARPRPSPHQRAAHVRGAGVGDPGTTIHHGPDGGVRAPGPGPGRGRDLRGDFLRRQPAHPRNRDPAGAGVGRRGGAGAGPAAGNAPGVPGRRRGGGGRAAHGSAPPDPPLWGFAGRLGDLYRRTRPAAPGRGYGGADSGRPGIPGGSGRGAPGRLGRRSFVRDWCPPTLREPGTRTRGGSGAPVCSPQRSVLRWSISCPGFLSVSGRPRPGFRRWWRPSCCKLMSGRSTSHAPWPRRTVMGPAPWMAGRGPQYWQNRGRYHISITALPPHRTITGTEQITYQNNSPDTLRNPVFKLLVNIHKPGAPRDGGAAEEYLTSGVHIDSFAVNGQSQAWGNDANTFTNRRVHLATPLLPHDSVHFSFAWHYDVSVQSGREGMIDSTTFFLAYFYPRVAVFDDYNGWDVMDFTDQQEFYSDFNDYDVSVRVPANYVVWGTGTLTNPDAVLTPEHARRLEASFTSDQTVHIATREEMVARSVTRQDSLNTWRFTANDIPDMTFGLSDHYVWDGASVVVDDATGRRASAQAAFNDTAVDYHSMVQFSRHALGWLSHNWPGVPYPYEKSTVFEGTADMEYPMMVNDNSFADTVFARFVVEHETAHTYFPFYMGINETRYGFMDEGWATTFEYLIGQVDVGPAKAVDFFKQFRVAGWIQDPSPLEDLPIITPEDVLKNQAYGNNAYGKPALGYLAVKDLLGDAVFGQSLREFMARWHGKHPDPVGLLQYHEQCVGKEPELVLERLVLLEQLHRSRGGGGDQDGWRIFGEDQEYRWDAGALRFDGALP